MVTDLFEYLCYVLIISILTSKDGPRTERVKRGHSYSVKLNDLDFVFTELANTMKYGGGGVK